MKNNILLILFFISVSFFGQQKFSKEISFVNDNDLYASLDRDRYYTNGMFLSYRYLTDNSNNKIEKKIIEWQIGHKMYTAYKPVVKTINLHDRPFAGYLYASYGTKKVFKNAKIFSTSIQIGIVGPNAYGKELQQFIHNIYGFEEAVGWQYQIKNAFGINFSSEYIKFLTRNNKNTFDISWSNAANLGTVNTDVSTGLNMRFGFIPLQNIANSYAYNTNLNNKNTQYKREIESFFFIHPSLRYALYDATLQGSFLNKSSLVTKQLVPLVFDLKLGFKFTANRFNFGYTFNYNTNKSKELRYTYGHKYGSISIQYLMD